MVRFWSFLQSLWPASWRFNRRPAAIDVIEPSRSVGPIDSPAAAVAPPPALEDVASEPSAPGPAVHVPPLIAIPAAVTVESLDEPDEGDAPEEDDEPADEDEDEDPSAPDPFVSPIRPPMDSLTPEALALKRVEAIQIALSGEHKIYFSDAAGPGTLAEALTQLLSEGRVIAEFCETPDEDPYLLYRPQ